VCSLARPHHGFTSESRVLTSFELAKQPGTALLDDHKATNYDANIVEALKKGTGRSSHVVLVPQPSDDPNDPLNWPKWLREANFWVLTFVAGIVGGVGPALAPSVSPLAALSFSPIFADAQSRSTEATRSSPSSGRSRSMLLPPRTGESLSHLTFATSLTSHPTSAQPRSPLTDLGTPVQ
jgi:hypothetical protein